MKFLLLFLIVVCASSFSSSLYCFNCLEKPELQNSCVHARFLNIELKMELRCIEPCWCIKPSPIFLRDYLGLPVLFAGHNIAVHFNHSTYRNLYE
ncbi:CLUMA_CG005788, isoform A [Clunio marinus]|uniref:CLUMA_CG005788, isoform A n=1 Tax=Clunio marinus TaxID=568069 RepID=A0A1J1HXD3_9DIPT|nr:CLUMA_CG005788, isoform A [Clunio marinus]